MRLIALSCLSGTDRLADRWSRRDPRRVRANLGVRRLGDVNEARLIGDPVTEKIGQLDDRLIGIEAFLDNFSELLVELLRHRDNQFPIRVAKPKSSIRSSPSTGL